MNYIEPLGWLWIVTLVLSIRVPRAGLLFVFILATALSLHLLPGFNNILIFDQVRFSPDSAPFNMYLNFDKTLAGLFIYLFIVKTQEGWSFSREKLLISFGVLAALVATLMPVALAIGYVRFDPKVPEHAWIWILNNLFLVCMAEEALFRGFIQNYLIRVFPRSRAGAIAAIVLASVLFGLAHYRGGVAYIALATVAGIFYGYAYWKTKRLEASILVHFGLNLIHFLFFSYPALMR